MREPFHSSKYSIAHAKRRIRELDGEIAIFLKSDPCAHLVDTNIQRGKDVHKIKLTKAMPAAVPGTAFDALNNLRSALDQAGYATAIAHDPSKGKNSHFPFGDTIVDANSCILRRSKDVPQVIFDYMMTFKPYRGGNDLLWALNKMCNSNKHEVITSFVVANAGLTYVATTSHAGMGISFPDGSGVSGAFTSAFSPVIGVPLSCIDDEVELFSVPSGQTGKYDLSFTFFVGVTKIDVVIGKPIVPLLDEFASIVERIVLGIEAEARRIGLVT